MNQRVNIDEMADYLASYTGKDKEECKRFLQAFDSAVVKGICSDKQVKVKGLGTFKVADPVKRAAVQTGDNEPAEIQGRRRVSFSPDKELKDLVNKPFSFFETTELNEGVEFTDLTQQVGEEKEGDADEATADELVPETQTAPQPEAEPKDAEVVEVQTTPQPEAEAVPQSEAEPAEAEVVESKPAEEEPSEVQTAPQPEAKVVEAAAAQTVTAEPDRQQQPAQHRSVAAVVWLLSVVLLLTLFFLYTSGCFENLLYPASKPAKPEEPVLPVAPEEPVVPAIPDELALPAIPEEPVVPVAPEEPPLPAEEPEAPAAESFDPVLAKVSIKVGDRLTLFARRYYGHKAFWVYIFEHNRSKIANPNNIPIGTTIEIPHPRLYAIDKDNPASVKQALEKQSELLGRYKS